MIPFYLLFDNGGGILLMAEKYCHSYDNPAWAAGDVVELLAGKSLEDWDGNEPEYRREQHTEDVLMWGTEARAIYDGEQWKHRGAAYEAFCWELAEIGRSKRAMAEAVNP